MLREIQAEYRKLKRSAAGHRFVDYYERTRRKESARETFWTTFAYMAIGLLLVSGGVLFSLTPGVPGFVLLIPGLALMAARSRRLAAMLDGLETWGRKVLRRMRPKRKR